MEQPSNNEKSPRMIGLELYQVETAIAIGKQTIEALWQVEPIDESAIAEERAKVHEARVKRNELRDDIYVAKAALMPIGRIEWIR